MPSKNQLVELAFSPRMWSNIVRESYCDNIEKIPGSLLCVHTQFYGWFTLLAVRTNQVGTQSWHGLFNSRSMEIDVLDLDSFDC